MFFLAVLEGNNEKRRHKEANHLNFFYSKNN